MLDRPKRDYFRKELPTMKQLQDAANRLMDKNMDAVARIALKCLEEGAFRQDRHEYKRSGDD